MFSQRKRRLFQEMGFISNIHFLSSPSRVFLCFMSTPVRDRDSRISGKNVSGRKMEFFPNRMLNN